jgi:putative transposase
MKNSNSLSHTKWDCKYHLVWIPKYRKKVLYGNLRKHLGDVFKELASHRESQIHEGHLMGDHIHMLISIPPKYSVSQVVGYIKGKSAIHIARKYMGKRCNFKGQSFWARGYYAATAGRDEEEVREYIRNQEAFDRRIDQLDLFK